MKKRLIFVLAALALCLAGCTGPSGTVYRSVKVQYDNTAASAFVTFEELQGKMVFTLKGEGRSGWRVRYSAKLESGSAMVYYEDERGLLADVCAVQAGDEVESSFGPFDLAVVKIYVETSGVCKNGAFYFDRE